jgi:hypothetical protein
VPFENSQPDESDEIRFPPGVACVQRCSGATHSCTLAQLGVIEDVHQSLMHILAQFIRQAHMEEGLIARRKF